MAEKVAGYTGWPVTREVALMECEFLLRFGKLIIKFLVPLKTIEY